MERGRAIENGLKITFHPLRTPTQMAPVCDGNLKRKRKTRKKNGGRHFRSTIQTFSFTPTLTVSLAYSTVKIHKKINGPILPVNLEQCSGWDWMEASHSGERKKKEEEAGVLDWVRKREKEREREESTSNKHLPSTYSGPTHSSGILQEVRRQLKPYRVGCQHH